MPARFEGKVAVVTGAARGLGASHARSFAREGADVAVTDLCHDLPEARYAMGAEAEMNSVVKEIKDLGRRAIGIRCDVTKAQDVENMVQGVMDEFGRIDILVNNAGASSKMMPFMKMTSEDWDYDIGVNLFGQMNVAHAVLPHMMSREQGRIINTSGGQGIPTLSTYGAAKAGVVMFTRALAKEVQGSGVIVTVYSPGLGATGLTADDPRMDSIAPTLPLGRLCTPQDVAPIVAFLASDLSSYMAASMVGSH